MAKLPLPPQWDDAVEDVDGSNAPSNIGSGSIGWATAIMQLLAHWQKNVFGTAATKNVGENGGNIPEILPTGKLSVSLIPDKPTDLVGGTQEGQVPLLGAEGKLSNDLLDLNFNFLNDLLLYKGLASDFSNGWPFKWFNYATVYMFGERVLALTTIETGVSTNSYLIGPYSFQDQIVERLGFLFYSTADATSEFNIKNTTVRFNFTHLPFGHIGGQNRPAERLRYRFNGYQPFRN